MCLLPPELKENSKTPPDMSAWEKLNLVICKIHLVVSSKKLVTVCNQDDVFMFLFSIPVCSLYDSFSSCSGTPQL